MLSPKSIAIVGASVNESKRGNVAIRHLLNNRFEGDIYPINPNTSYIHNLACYSSLDELPTTPDLALICTPAHTLPDIIQDCGDRGIPGAVVLATGFSETGDNGLQLENQMVEVAKQCGVRIIGPNTSGIFNAHCGANLVGYQGLKAGNIGLLSQSGNMALSLVTEGTHHDSQGFSTYVGVGNEADVQFHEYLDYFAEDPNTQVVIGYIEGLKGGRQFFETAQRISLEKPIVLYKSGRTQIGQQSAKSHTGALAGSYVQAKGIMHQCGVTLVERADEILPVAETLAALHDYLPLVGKRVAILADGGGHATIAADALDHLGISIPLLDKHTQTALSEWLPAGAPVSNPIDVAGGTDSNPERFADCANEILQDENIDALLIVGLFGGYALRFAESLAPMESRCAERLGKLATAHNKPILLQSLYKPSATAPLIRLKELGIPVFESIDVATRCLSAVMHYSEARHRLAHLNTTDVTPSSDSVIHLIDQALNEERASLYEFEAMEALAAYGAEINTPSVIRTSDALHSATLDIHSGPMVMKLVSQDILHKTDAGGVILNLEKHQLDDAYNEIITNAKAYNPEARVEGVLIADMAEPGTEIIIGVSRDPQYGPVMMFGLGGIFVEVLKDITFRALPLSQADAREMLNEIRSRKILLGIRGKQGINQEALISLMMAISDLCANHPEITELDLNPVLVNETGYNVLDARIVLAPQQEDGE